MFKEKESLVRKMLRAETEWNPKVVLGRALVRVLPESLLHPLKKTYYGYLITHSPEGWIEKDAFIAEDFISPGDHVLDIGANLGYFSRFLARRVGSEGMVYAFEPIPQTFDFLAHNVRKLALNNVKCLNFALSDEDKTETMVIPTYRWGQECWYDARIKTPNSNPKWREFKVQSRTLDDYFKQMETIPKISFIKCDANYHELAVLRGALQTLRSCYPAMLIEVNPNPDDSTTTAYATFALLRSEGYEVFWCNGEQLVPRHKGERSQNYFFLRPEHLRMLESKAVLGSTSAN